VDKEKVIALGESASKGSDESFVLLCEEMKQPLYRAAMGILGRESLALDAVSEAVCRAYKAIHKLKEPRFTATWFTRILLNCAKDIYRKEKYLSHAEYIPDKGYTDDYSFMEFESLISSLPMDLKQVVSLKYFSCLSLTEISEILKIPPGTAKSKLNRALKILRLEVEEN
jgi:RNA polymerase sigma-70 factor (ECF subfamily)